MNTDRFKRTFFISFAPIVLCVIAGVQIYLAGYGSLSPWKGGGFGMFSTVDSPSARFLRIYLIQEDKEIAVLIPDPLKRLAREAQALPTAPSLQTLANRMAQGTWVPYQLTPAVQHYQTLTYQMPILDFYDLQQLAAPKPTDDPAVIAMNRSLYTKGYISLEGLQFFRMVGENEPTPPADEVVAFHQVRAELWRYTFDAEALQLKAAKVIAVTVAREAK